MQRKALVSLILGLAMPVVFVAAQDKQEEKGRWDSFHDQQTQERKAYRQTLSDKTPQDREASLREFRAKQRHKKKEFRQALRQENIAILRNRLADNTKLTALEKEELVDFFQQQYEENDSLKDQAHQEAVVLFAAIANDSGLTREQKKEELKKTREQEKAKAAAFWDKSK